MGQSFSTEPFVAIQILLVRVKLQDHDLLQRRLGKGIFVVQPPYWEADSNNKKAEKLLGKKSVVSATQFKFVIALHEKFWTK